MASVWNHAESHSGKITLKTHTAFLTVAGPPRSVPSQPVVVVEAGHSDCSNNWVAVVRAVSPFARILTYDRAGYGWSSPSSLPRTAENIAAELSALLDAAGVAGLFVLVGHSMGGILVREFIALRDKDVAGSVAMGGAVWVLDGMDRHEVTGLSACRKLTDEEWEKGLEAEKEEGFEKTSKREGEEVIASAKALAAKKQFEDCVLGDRRLSVLKGDNKRDIDRMYEVGVKLGNGTKEQQGTSKSWLDRIGPIWERNQREQFKLSRNSRMVYTKDTGHHVHVEDPEAIAEEVKWVLESLS